MKNLRHILVVVIVPALILTVFAVSSVMAQGPAGKVEVCHAAAQKYVEINVSTNALDAHMRHGDVLPDEYGDCP
jgi:response regulator of citrate/malate metabolism